MVGWLLQTHLGSLVVGDLNSVINIRTCGPRVKIIWESEAPVSSSSLPLEPRLLKSVIYIDVTAYFKKNYNLSCKCPGGKVVCVTV